MEKGLTAACGPLSVRLIWAVARNVRRHRDPLEADSDGSTEEDLVQNLATVLWEVRHRRPDAGIGYQKRALYLAAAMMSRTRKRARQHKVAVAEAVTAGHHGWWARHGGFEDGVARMMACVKLSKLMEAVPWQITQHT